MKISTCAVVIVSMCLPVSALVLPSPKGKLGDPERTQPQTPIPTQDPKPDTKYFHEPGYNSYSPRWFALGAVTDL